MTNRQLLSGCTRAEEANAAGHDGSAARVHPDPVWVRPALVGLLLLTGVLYLWALDRSGWANSFYSAAAQAGSVSWKAWFYGASDAGNAITVDKPPAALWIMGLSVRIFGVSAWSILAPQALIGVASTGLLYATVKRWHGPAAGLIAGAVLALTPTAVLVFRFNNPDALLVLLLIGGAWAVTRAVETGQTRWLILAGTFVGFGFLTKLLQALLVVPAFALVYLIAGPPRLRVRIGQLLAACLAVVVSAGWYLMLVELVPDSQRPYIGGSQDNSLLQLAFGYNGLGRLTGTDPVAAAGSWGAPGLPRLFGTAVGGQISWLLPAALILLAAGLAWTVTRARRDRDRAALALWGAWLLTAGLVLSHMNGIFHPYYTVVMAPAIGAVTGIAATTLWRHRHQRPAAVIGAAVVAVTAWWSHHLLTRTAGFLPELHAPLLAAGVAASAAVLAAGQLRPAVANVGAVVTGAVLLTGPAVYAVQTASEAHIGSFPAAGPSLRPVPDQIARTNTRSPMATLLQADAGKYRWTAATVCSLTAAGYQLNSGTPVMPVGGFTGTDPAPTLAQFQQHVAAGSIHYFIAGPGCRAATATDGSAAAQITAWVTSTFPSQALGRTAVYDLTAPAARQAPR
jgi:4-amino-4-deoxy-L-arabinose transferase-like glycosyltransferase